PVGPFLVTLCRQERHDATKNRRQTHQVLVEPSTGRRGRPNGLADRPAGVGIRSPSGWGAGRRPGWRGAGSHDPVPDRSGQVRPGPEPGPEDGGAGGRAARARRQARAPRRAPMPAQTRVTAGAIIGPTVATPMAPRAARRGSPTLVRA